MPINKDTVIQQSHAIAWRSLFTHLVLIEIFQISNNKTKRCFFLIYTHNVDKVGPGLTASLPPDAHFGKSFRFGQSVPGAQKLCRKYIHYC